MDQHCHEHPYEPFAAIKQATLGNTLSMTANWGNDGRLASRRLYKTTGGVDLSLLSYAYDNDDNITGITYGVNAANSISYAYDVRGGLNRVTATASSSAPHKRTDWLDNANACPERLPQAGSRRGNRTALEKQLTIGQVALDGTPDHS